MRFPSNTLSIISPFSLSAPHPTPRQDLSGKSFLVFASSCSQCPVFRLDTRCVHLRAMTRGQYLKSSVTSSSCLNLAQSQVTFL